MFNELSEYFYEPLRAYEPLFKNSHFNPFLHISLSNYYYVKNYI